jgi:putative MFS transporter
MSKLQRLGGVTFHNAWAFWFGVVAVTLGVIWDIPMYLMGRNTGYRLVGMPTDAPMMVGMALIVVGLIASLYGLYPRSAEVTARAVSRIRVSALDDVRLSLTHVSLLLAMALAVIIDVMKPTALAFVIPGITLEYGLKSPLNPGGTIPAAWLALSGITGTVLGSFLWGWLGDRIGRRASILYAGIGFIATSICGAMPDFSWNLVMCFIMGICVGGMLPICYALLAEAIPARHRGWLILNRWIPESPRFLLATGREDRLSRRSAARPCDRSIVSKSNSISSGRAAARAMPMNAGGRAIAGASVGHRFPVLSTAQKSPFSTMRAIRLTGDATSSGT